MVALALLGGGSTLADDRSTEGKKVIIFGGLLGSYSGNRGPDFYTYFREHGNRTRVTGVVAQFWLPSSKQLANCVISAYPIARADVAGHFDDFKSVSHMFPDSLLRITPPAKYDLDWFDDATWDIIFAKVRMLSELAADAGMRGFAIDTEQYRPGVFMYGLQAHREAKSFEEYQAQVRRRGRQLMEVMAVDNPQATILYMYANSFLYQQIGGDASPVGEMYGLLPAFIDGMMEGGPEAEFIDGFEQSYISSKYKTHGEFVHAAGLIREGGRKISTLPELYARKMKVGFGLWPPGDEGFKTGRVDPAEYSYSADDLEHALHYALRESDGLVWLYMGKALEKWWTVLPEDYLAAIDGAWDSHPLDRRPDRVDKKVPWAAEARGRPEVKDEAAFFHLKGRYVEVMDLPLQWKFRIDERDVGEKGEWFAKDYDDSPWKDIEIREWWQPQGYMYNGYAWYRVKIKAPEVASRKGMILAFGAVDEQAWVWVNGAFAGKHALGVEGWVSPFEIDVSELIRPGQANQITVKVHDSMGVGGIWKGVKLMVPEE